MSISSISLKYARLSGTLRIVLRLVVLIVVGVKCSDNGLILYSIDAQLGLRSGVEFRGDSLDTEVRKALNRTLRQEWLREILLRMSFGR